MPQRDLLLPWLSAIDNAALALRNRGVRRGRGAAPGRRSSSSASAWPASSARAPAELSGGMRQRVAFLRTLIAGKPVLALDEPFASLDAITRAEMQEWLAGALAADPRTVVLVTHDVEEALYLSDRVAVLSARPARVVERAERAGAARRRPRRRRHRPRVRRRPRAGDAAPCDEGAQMKRWLLPPCCSAALIGAWQIAAEHRRARRRCSTSKASSSPPRPKSPNRSGRAARCSPKTPGSPCRRSCSASAARSSPGSRFAVAMHLSETLRRAFYPLLVASQTIPIVVIAPILVVWFGFGIGPKLAIVALICFFPITVNTLDGLRSVDPEATKMMRTLDASRGQILWRVEAPAALPYFFSGAKIAVAVAAIGAVFGEWAGSELRARPPDPPGQRPAGDRAGLRRGRRPLRDRARPLRPRRPRRAPRRHLAIESRG